MHVRNTHNRVWPVKVERVGELLDSLSSPTERLWAREHWPAMRFDRPLGVGARGGHGPIRYWVDAYEPGRRVLFRFTGPKGFNGQHGFEVEPTNGGTRLTHRIDMQTSGPALLSWPLVFRPLHDALLEDSLDKAAIELGMPPQRAGWSLWVRFLRLLAGRVKQTKSPGTV